jgi:lipopolysaccharide transport system permease protein
MRMCQQDADSSSQASLGRLQKGGAMTSDSTPLRPVLELTGESTPVTVLLRDLRRQLHLLPVLARQDFTARYRSASLGMVWSVVLPLLQGAVLAVVFTHIVRIQVGASYPIFVISGVNTWNYFSTSILTGSTSIADTSSLAGRVYFPRLLLAAMPCASGLPSYAIANGVLLILMAAFHVGYTWRIALLPLVMLLASLLAFAVGAIAAMLHVYYRDVRYLVTAAILVWFYATPVIYPLTRTHQFQPYIVANPATGLVQAVRWCVLGTATDAGRGVVISIGWLLGLLVVVIAAYRRYERVAVDRL